MGYADQKFYSRKFMPVGFNVDYGTGTGTGSDDYTMSDVHAPIPKFERRSKVSAFRFRCTTAPEADATSLVAAVKSGTNTFGTAVLTTATADQIVDGVITSAANSVVGTDVQPTIDLVVTSTGTDDALGDYDVWFEVQELFDGAA